MRILSYVQIKKSGNLLRGIEGSATMMVKRPTIFIDKKLTVAKIERMADKAKSSGVRFRPHFKTHRSAAIGEWFRRYGVSKIAVSSVEMAKYFANNGWNDVMICVPANVREIDEVNKLSRDITLHLLVDSIETTKILMERMDNRVKTWIEIDVGYGRTGVPSTSIEEIKRMASYIRGSSNLTLTGIITHAGHSYNARTHDEIRRIHHESVSQMKSVKESLVSAGYSDIEVSVGDTPTCSVMDRFEKPIDEMRPGNFVFYDLTQLNIGSCTEEDISMTIACPVISKHPERDELVIYGGGTSLSKEYYISKDGKRIYGLISLPRDRGRTSSIKDVYISSLSQEHGKISGPSEFIESVDIGDILMVLPVHACQAALLYSEYRTFDGEIITSFQI